MLVFLTSLGALLALVYEEDVSNYALASLNKHLRSDIQVSQISFSLLRNFPSASLRLSDALIMEVDQNKNDDTLLYTESVILNFSIIDILRKEYRVNSLLLENSIIHISVDANGKDNFHFWQESTENAVDTSFLLQMEKVQFETLQFIYSDKQAKQHMDFAFDDLIMRGDFSSKDFALDVYSVLLVKQYKSSNTAILTNKNMVADFTLQVNTNIQEYVLSRSKVKLGGNDLQVSGSVKNMKNSVGIDLFATVKELDISAIPAFFGPSVNSALEPYNISGKGSFDLTWQGSIVKGSLPRLDIRFTILDGDFQHKSTGVRLNNANFSGQLVAAQKENLEHLQIDTLSGDLAGNAVTGKFSLTGFNDPLIRLQCRGEVPLEDLHGFFQAKDVQSAGGIANFNLQVAGRYMLDEKEFRLFNSGGNIALKDASILLAKSTLPFSAINGEIVLLNESIGLNSISLEVGESRLTTNGILQNFINYLMQEDKGCTIEAELHASKLKLDELLTAPDSIETTTGYMVTPPPNINLNLSVIVDELQFRRFVATNVRGQIIAKHKSIVAQNLRFNSVGGSVSSTIVLGPGENNGYLASCSATLKDLNIDELFYQMENFGQNFISHENLNGTSTATIEYQSSFSPSLEVDPASIKAVVQLEILDGELNNFAPLQEVATYIKKHKILNKIVKTDAFGEKLKNVRFSDLANTIEIKDQCVTIPKMELRSNAMDINIAGNHYFDNKIDYRMNFRLSELLTQKERDEELVSDEEGGIRIFMSMTGTTENPVFDYDKEARKNYKNSPVRAQSQEIKSILQKEFGKIPANSSTSSDATPEPAFLIEWDELPADTTSSKAKTPEQKETKFNSLLNKMGIDPATEKKSDTFNPEDDDDL